MQTHTISRRQASARRRAASAGLIAAAAAGLLAAAAADAQERFGPPELATTRVTDDVHVIRDRGSGNVTVLVADHGVLLIDDKFPQNHAGLLAEVAKLTDQPVRFVINTHMHADHSGGNALLQALGVPVIASANARRIMAETQTEGLPDITIDEHLRIHFGGKPVDLYYFGRGHTNGDVVVHLPEDRIVVMGDLFALYGPYEHLIHYAAGGSARDWSQTLERVLELDFDTVIPGHSAVTDRANLEGYLAETLRLQDMVREMNRQQRPREEIEAVLRSEFNWSGLSMQFGLDGIIAEMR